MQKVEVIATEDIKKLSYDEMVEYRSDIISSFISPILFALLVGLKEEIVLSLNGRDKILLRELARAYREGDGDCGICFEYSIHSAIRKNSPLIIEQIKEALQLCGINSKYTTSILLGFEKSKILQINDELLNTLSKDSILVTNSSKDTIQIWDYLSNMTSIFRSANRNKTLPTSISGIWKADLLLGNPVSNMWAAASVKINHMHLRNVKGIAIGICPTKWNKKASVHQGREMIICHVPFDNGFMHFFYITWNVIYKFLQNDAYVPHERLIPYPEQLEIAKYLESKRDTPVIELVDDLFLKISHKNILLPQKNPIITTNPFGEILDNKTNSTIIIPNII